MKLLTNKISFQTILSILIFIENGDGCLFRTWNLFTSSTDSSTRPSKEPIKLDTETRSILQQTFLKVLLERGKLNFQCPSEHGLFPDLLDCRKYYNCTNHNYVTEVCGNDLGFEPLAKSCVRDESVPLCQQVQKLTGYACNNTGLQVYEGNCEKFILCTKEGSAYISSCNRGDMFDQKWLLCLPENETNCSGTVQAVNV